MSESKPGTKGKTKIKGMRLPCRGCTRQCKNYDRCDGKSWRINDRKFVGQGNLSIVMSIS